MGQNTSDKSVSVADRVEQLVYDICSSNVDLKTGIRSIRRLVWQLEKDSDTYRDLCNNAWVRTSV